MVLVQANSMCDILKYVERVVIRVPYIYIYIVLVQDYSMCDILKYVERVVDLVPWVEFSQKEFLQVVIPANMLNQGKKNIQQPTLIS